MLFCAFLSITAFIQQKFNFFKLLNRIFAPFAPSWYSSFYLDFSYLENGFSYITNNFNYLTNSFN